MNTEPCKPRRDFFFKYYDWSVRDALYEYHNNFSTFRNIPCRNLWRFLEFFDELTLEEREPFLLAVLARAHARKLPELQQHITLNEKSLVDQYFRPTMLLISKQERDILAGIEMGEIKIADRRLIKKITKNVISELLDMPPEKWSSNTFHWDKTIGNYIVSTDLDTGAANSQMTYCHSVYTHDRSCRLIENVSVLSWCGISGMSTWDYTQESAVEEFSLLFRGIISRFLAFTEILKFDS